MSQPKNNNTVFINKHLFKPDKNLEEPICTTLKKDLGGIFVKLRYTLFPFSLEEKRKELRDWDLFGPLLITVLLTV
jgi:hypothetical protein